MMVDAATGALDDAGGHLWPRIVTVDVVRGIWPYRDPGRLVAERVGCATARTGLTRLGGNEAFDLVNARAAEIAGGRLDVALICSAETMRTRRQDRAEGGSSTYLREADDASPDELHGHDRDLADAVDFRAAAHQPVNFYAMSEVAIRHRRGESHDEHRRRIAELWARASACASANPDAWITTAFTASEIATPGPGNRMVAEPYPKLMTSNIDVDMAAAVVLASAEAAAAAGVPTDRMVPIAAGTGATDHWITRTRWELDASPALRLAGERALELAGLGVDEVELLDLYSCFPAAVQVTQEELGIAPDRPFTITGGLTFAGGPYNSYCMHALARAVELIRGGARSALLSGNGGFFTKHSFTVLDAGPPAVGFRHERPQAAVDSLPSRPDRAEPPSAATVEAYTVTFDHEGVADRGIVAVLDSAGSRTWTNTRDPDMIGALLSTDCCGRPVDVRAAGPDTAPEVHLR